MQRGHRSTVKEMATRLSVLAILERGKESDYEGKEIAGYQPKVPGSSR